MSATPVTDASRDRHRATLFVLAAAVLGAVVLGERPGARAVAGMVLVGSGLVLLAGWRRPRADKPPTA